MSLKIDKSKLIEKLLNEKKVAFDYQKRRHDDWNENYLLYRGQVSLNRLTQRQEVVVPLMKETVRTILSRIDDQPDEHFENRSGNQDAEILVNELYQQFKRQNNIDLIDRTDKKQVLLYGRSHKKLNWLGNRIGLELKDTFDLLVDPKTLPYDIDTARFLVEPNIMRPLNEVVSNEKYDKAAREALKNRYSNLENETTGETVKPANTDQLNARNERMDDMGADMDDDMAGSEIILVLDQYFTHIWDEKEKKYVKYVVLVAEDSDILSCKTLKEIIGIDDFWPFEGWADDLEATDYWSDSVGDVLRQPNKVVNAWLSQEIENRTLANYGMNFYDSTVEGFEPQSFDPRPFGWYPLPGKPNEVYQRVDVQPFPGNLKAIEFVIGLAEKATASSAVEKGSLSSEKRTLGEIEIAVGKAQERINSMQPYYRRCWQRVAEKWLAIMEANTTKDSKTVLYKKGFDGVVKKKVVKGKEWESKDGYSVTVDNARQRSASKIEALNTLFAIKQTFPENKALEDAIRKRSLQIGDLSPEEINKINEEADQRKQEVKEQQTQVQSAQQVTPQAQI